MPSTNPRVPLVAGIIRSERDVEMRRDWVVKWAIVRGWLMAAAVVVIVVVYLMRR
jgi:hypothetical protein